MNPIYWKTFVVIAIVIPAASVVHAQPVFESKPSIEGIVLNADTVVLGTFVEFTVGEKFHDATIAVEETLRGRHHKQLRVRLFANRWLIGLPTCVTSELADLKGESHRLLVATDGQPRIVRGLVELSSKELDVYTADLTALRTPEEVLLAARETIRRTPGVTRVETFLLALPMEGGYFHRGGRIHISVPVDEALEKRAQEYVAASARWKRMDGLRALRYFKSDENVARAKTLLDDPERVMLEEDGVKVWYYPLRACASETLTYWGIAVDESVFRKKIQDPEVPGR